MVRNLADPGVNTASVLGRYETCWKLHIKPPNAKKKGEGRAFQATSDQEPQSSSTTFPLTKEQLDQPYKFLESQTPSCSVVQKGNFSQSTHLSVIPNHSWIVDFRATDHMIGESSLFSSKLNMSVTLFQMWQTKVLMFCLH